MNNIEKADIIIIGAGVIGLAIAEEVGKKYKDIIVLEKYPMFGQETSSRNSEVIHAGIYYPKDSLKAKFCVEGHRLLYELCEKERVPYKRLGKLIVAIDNEEKNNLEKLLKQGLDNGVEDLELLSKGQIKRIEPNIRALCAIYSPSTGIVDTHRLMKYLESSAKEKGVMFAYNCEVIGIKKKRDGYEVHIRDADGEKITLPTRFLVNSAGLHSDRISHMLGLDKPDYRLVYCKGQYFRLSSKKSSLIRSLIYPVPNPEDDSLGIHATPDLTGSVRLGPDTKYINRELDYNIDESRRGYFCDSVKNFLPFVEREDLSSDIAGIRPKLHGPNEGFRDFIIRDEKDNNFPNFINLIGIESPGLTCLLAIARYVRNIVEKNT